MSTSTGFPLNTMASPGRTKWDNDGSFTESNLFALTCTPIDLHNFLRTRRSIRRFRPALVPDSVLQSILATATYAPSAHNRQPWRFVVLTDPSIKLQLAEAMARDFERDLIRDGVAPEKIAAQITRSKSRMTSAPVVILLCLDMSEMDSYSDSKRQQAERAMATQSVAAAGLQLLLAAHAEGLGGVWVCAPLFAQETIQRSLNLKETWEPHAMFYIGYPDVSPETRERKSVESISIFM